MRLVLSERAHDRLTVHIRTIHGLVYNALKLFMDTNPALFEECTQRYQREVQSEAQRAETRRLQWEKIENLAKANPKYQQLIERNEAVRPSA